MNCTEKEKSIAIKLCERMNFEKWNRNERERNQEKCHPWIHSKVVCDRDKGKTELKYSTANKYYQKKKKKKRH